ncbi:hypothetical protein NIES267_26380 [Calothrix parasitica NIES-267]|uniref:Uncharacterized protein n=1 Tax=Calothrix parasitica NIES-267 TaxID=1973488 RepID=A0A1Z4LPK3_9CYAN|nr:hypothetical protein NIES267_26380 [Calothrix parasitica NIES-267]
MRRSKLIGLILGTSLVLNGLLTDSASAQSSGPSNSNLSNITGSNLSNITGSNLSNVTNNNLSNITGTNVFNPGPFFTKSGELNPQINERAQQLAEELQDAYQSCSVCNPCKLRGFLIGNKPKTTINQTSNSSKKCKKYNTLLSESKTFLNEVNQQVEVVKTSITNRDW